MKNYVHNLHERSKRVHPALLWIALLIVGVRPCGFAHDVLATFIQHGVQLRIDVQHIDVTVDLTFFEEWSAREREVMDADGSGNITRAEQEVYLKTLGPRLSRQVKICVAGRELALVPLYDPEVDLLADSKVGPAHHRLRLFFFVATPADLRAGEEIVIEDTLWPDARTLATPQSEGRDGCKLMLLDSVNAGLGSTRAQEKKRLFKFRCLQPPAKAIQAENPSSRTRVAAVKSSVEFPQVKASTTRSNP